MKKSLIIYLVPQVFLIQMNTGHAQAQIISTPACNCIVTATSESNSPVGVAVDGSGNVYIADAANSRIRKINTAGVITTILQNGVAGLTGDSATATASGLNFHQGVTTDGSGNVYIARRHNQPISEVDKINPTKFSLRQAGTPVAIAGNGTTSNNHDHITATVAKSDIYAGASADGSGTVYTANARNNRVHQFDVFPTEYTASSAVAGNADMKVTTTSHLSFFKKVSLAWRLRRSMRHHYYGKGTGNNALGISSVAAAALPLLATGCIALFGQASAVAGVFTILTVVTLAPIAAIVLGAIGKGRDRKRGFAIAGMVMGIVETAIILVGALLIVAIVSSL